MATEIWIWIKEQAGRFLEWLGSVIVRGWRMLGGWLATISGSTWRKVAVAIPLLFVAYILVGMPIVHRIDDETSIDIAAPEGGSKTVATLRYLVKRETKDNGWTPNDPVFQPGWWIDNTPNFQKGMMGALSRFAFELRDQVGRTRGSSDVDPNLELAAGNLAREPDRWVIDFAHSWLPTTPSDGYYRQAIKELDAYNTRLAKGEAVFERRSDNLLATLDRIALDLGASSAALETYIAENGGGFLPDFGADDLFYRVKGQVYAYAVILKALRVDFAAVIEDREIAALYGELLKSMTIAAELDPLIVTNGKPDGVLANHLSMQGFYLLRARTQLREVSNILLK